MRGILLLPLLLSILARDVLCTEENDKYVYAVTVAQYMVDLLFNAFNNCMQLPMSTHMYAIDDIHRFLNSHGRTTIGLTKEFAQNRKFLANLLAHPDFRRMINIDVTRIRNSIQDKMRFCRDAIFDKEILPNYYFLDNGESWSRLN